MTPSRSRSRPSARLLVGQPVVLPVSLARGQQAAGVALDGLGSADPAEPLALALLPPGLLPGIVQLRAIVAAAPTLAGRPRAILASSARVAARGGARPP